MARVNVYLPDDLHEEVKQSGIEISPICQTALRAAIDSQHRSKDQQLSLLRAVDRIALTARQGPLRKAEGRKQGLRWAESSASLGDLQALDGFWVAGGHASRDHHGSSRRLDLTEFETLKDWLDQNVDLDDGRHEIGLDNGHPSWQVDDFTEGFFAAATEFWATVKPLLDEPESVRHQKIEQLQNDIWTDEPPF